MKTTRLRPMTQSDRFEVAELIYGSINVWYEKNGRPPLFAGGPRVTEVFYDVYNALAPGCNVVAEHPETSRLMGSCFYHPRKHHVSLGIMNVHPNYFGFGVGRALLEHIIDFTESKGFKALRLTSSALNLDSFSLYNRAGFVPRCAFQDMLIQVPAGGMKESAPGKERVRPAKAADVGAMAELEMEVSGISREEDYRYCIANEAGYWHAAVYENARGGIDGFMLSSGAPGPEHARPLRGTVRRGRGRPDFQGTQSLRRALPSVSHPSRENEAGAADVRLGSPKLRAALLSGPRRIQAVSGNQHAVVPAGDRLRAILVPGNGPLLRPAT